MISLTERQLLLWRLRGEGLRVSEIASRLGISRQAVHKGLQSVEAKVYKALISAARANKVEIKRVDARRGLLIGWSPALGLDVYITFSSTNGVQVWYAHEGNCKDCSFRDDCREILLSEAEERGISLPLGEEAEPSQLAEILFSELLRGG